MAYQQSFIKGMTKKKLTQKEAIFYTLFKNFKNPETKENFIPVFKFMGEIYAEELGLWGYVSHECSARCSELKKTNNKLIEVKEITGKSGARYFGYRFYPTATPSLIEDPGLQKFYKTLAKRIKIKNDYKIPS